ncbi:MAG: ABC transporter permease [Dehalococcoidales bacterium]|nr:ABC transporter permease [Dehalococcoidales bacterium]
MKNLKHIWFIALKDLKIFTKDRAAVFFFIGFPFLFIILFSFLLGGVGSEDERMELHMVTLEAAGGLSHQIIGAMETMDKSQLGPGAPKMVWDRDYDEARRAVEDGELDGFIAFPADFTQALMTGSGTQLEVFADAGNVNARAALNGLAGAISSQIGTHQVIINSSVALMVEGGVIPADTASINTAVQQIMNELFAAGAAGAEASYVTFRTEKVGEVEAENPANFVIPGYLVMFVFFAAAVTAETLVRERQNHTLERLLATSVRRESILGGVFTGTALRGLIQIVIFWVVGILAFNVDLGLSPLAVIILSILMVIMSSAFAVMLATLARTQRSAGSLATITGLLLAPLGGCWWPFFLYPDWLQTIARITPHAWATSGFNKLMVFGADFSSAVPNMLALLGFAAVFGAVAVWRFRTSAA